MGEGVGRRKQNDVGHWCGLEGRRRKQETFNGFGKDKEEREPGVKEGPEENLTALRLTFWIMKMTPGC